jgi:hypothetical protein
MLQYTLDSDKQLHDSLDFEHSSVATGDTPMPMLVAMPMTFRLNSRKKSVEENRC